MKISSYIANSVLSASALSLILYAASSHAAALDVSQSPLMLVDSVAPNLLFTLDDSGSMEFAFSPDGLGDSEFEVNGVIVCPSNSNGCRHTRLAKSYDLNPLYVNHDVKYVIPKKADGSYYSTSFTSAPWNGFKVGDTRYLSHNYRS